MTEATTVNPPSDIIPPNDIFDTPGTSLAFTQMGMTHSHEIDKLATAMAKAQEKITNPGFDSENPHYHSKYASLAQVLLHIRQACAGQGLVFTQHPCSSNGSYGCQSLVIHSSGQWMRSELQMKPERGSIAHACSSCVTYCKRIAAQAIWGIAADEDDDGNAAIEPAKTDVSPKREVPVLGGTPDNKALTVAAFQKWTGAEPEELKGLIMRTFKAQNMRMPANDKLSDPQWKTLLDIAETAMKAGVAYHDKYPAS